MTVVPSLSSSGWVDDDETYIQVTFLHFMTSAENQANILLGRINSVAYIAAKFGTIPQSFADELATALTGILYDRFPIVTVEAKVENDTGGMYDVSIYASVTNAEGKVINWKKAITNDRSGAVNKLLESL